MVDWKMQNQDEKKSQSRSLSRSAPPCTEHTSALSLLAAVVAKHSNGLLHSGEPDQKSHVGNCVCVCDFCIPNACKNNLQANWEQTIRIV